MGFRRLSQSKFCGREELARAWEKRIAHAVLRGTFAKDDISTAKYWLEDSGKTTTDETLIEFYTQIFHNYPINAQLLLKDLV